MVPYKKYASRDGLLSDRVTAINQDEKGFMWFGSYFGICRYDGRKFDKIDLPPSQQNKYVTFLEPAGGKMYAGFLFSGGLAEYHQGKTNAWFIKGKDSAAANDFVCMTDNGDGSILICNTANQLYRFKNGVFTHLYTIRGKIPSYPRSLKKDKANNLWLATGKGVLILPYPYKTEQLFFNNKHVSSLVKDDKKTLWFAISNGKTSSIQKATNWHKGKLINHDTVSNLQDLTAIPFMSVASRGFWGIAPDSSLVHVDQRSNKLQYKIPLDFTTDISVIFCDRENNIWIANEPGVLKISNFNSQGFLFSEIAAGGGDLLIQNDLMIWATNSKHLYTIKQNRVRKHFPALQKADYYGTFHLDRNNYLWIGLWNEGVWKTKWNNGKLVYKKEYKQFRNKKISASSIVEDGEGTIWLGGINGLFGIRQNGTIQHFQPLNHSGSPVFISCMAIDTNNKTLWLGDNAQGIIKTNYSFSGSQFHLKQTGFIASAHGLKDGYTRSLVLDHKNDLWVGTRFGGIFQVKENDGRFIIKDHNKAAKLSCTRVTDIEQEDTSALWFATCNGIYRYQFKTGSWHHYTTSDGLLNAEIYSVAIDSRNKYIWALTAQGVTKLSYTEKPDPVPPLISIINVQVLGKEDPGASFSKTNKYSFTKNSIGFSFAGASFLDEEKIRYRYILEGYSNTWSNPVVTNSISYASLPPGSYVFKVMAANANGVWSIQPATFRFEIVRPFYRSLWFYFICITAGLFLFYFIRLQRLRQSFKIEKLRLSIAKDLHDDIGSTLGSINLLSQTASRRMVNNETGEVIPIFQKISRSAENTLEAMDDIVWSINPEKDKLQDVIIRMREFAIPLLEAKNIQFHFQVEKGENISIPMNLRRNLFLIFKESIHNIIKHSCATKATIQLKVESQQVHLGIVDNGKGFCIAGSTTRNGLNNLQSRSKAVGGHLEILSGNTGTSILFIAPIR